MNDLLTIRQIEDIAGTLRKYRLTPADALALSKALVHAVDGPVAVQAADLASLMRPRRPAPERDLAAQERRRVLRQALPAETVPGTYYLVHDVRDRAALKSAIQYRAERAGLAWTITVHEETHCRKPWMQSKIELVPVTT